MAQLGNTIVNGALRVLGEEFNQGETIDGNLDVTSINSVNVGSSPKFTDTTYTFTNGTNGFKVTPSGGSAQTVTVTPSITNNVTGSGTNAYLAKFTGANTIGNGPAIGSDTTKYLRNDGTWQVPPDHTYNFSGVDFVSGNKDTGSHDANATTANGHYYYSYNGPTTAMGASTNDGALYVASYNGSWIGQIAQDYRNGNIFVRGKNNGTWQTWKKPDAGSVNGYTVAKSVPSDAVFTDTTYTFAGGTNKFTVTPSGGSAQTVTVTPSITNNVTGSGTSAYLAKFTGANTIGNGPAIGSDTTKYLRNDGTWQVPPNDNTKNTAGSTDTSSKIFLIGATSQAANPQTYSDDQVYTTSGTLTANKLTSKYINEILTGTGTAATSSGSTYYPAKWAFNIGVATPADGDMITIKIPCAGHDNGVFVSLDNGTTYKPVGIQTQGNGRLTTHFPNGRIITLMYDSTSVVDSVYAAAGATARSNITGAWKVVTNYNDDNSNTYDRNRYNANIKAWGTALVGGNIIVGSEGVYHHLKEGTAFDIRYPILYLAENVAANSTTTNTYDIIHFTSTTTQNTSWTAYLPVFIKCTLANNIFKPISTTPLTQIVPTSFDGYVYMLLGIATSTTTIYLQERHPMYKFQGGVFAEYEHSTGNNTTASGSYAHTEGDSTQATNSYAHAEGYQAIASGIRAHAEGLSATASSDQSHAEGCETVASGSTSHAEGYQSKALNQQSHAEGWQTTANGNYSHTECLYTKTTAGSAHAEGRSTLASAEAAHAEGYNTTSSNCAAHSGGHWNAAMTTGGAANNTTGTALVIGNGTGSSTLKNAFSVQYSGVVKAASTITASTTADYAEYFEWADENPNNEDRVGYFIAFDSDNKIKIGSNLDEYILGVSSGEPFVLGNGDCDVWNGMVLRDEFRRVIYEPAPKLDEEEKPMYDDQGNPLYQGTRPKLNPRYDPTIPYINRADRPEWQAVGMLGVLAIRDNGACQINSYCSVASDGTAKPYTNGDIHKYRVIHRNSQNVIEIVFR